MFKQPAFLITSFCNSQEEKLILTNEMEVEVPDFSETGVLSLVLRAKPTFPPSAPGGPGGPVGPVGPYSHTQTIQ